MNATVSGESAAGKLSRTGGASEAAAEKAATSTNISANQMPMRNQALRRNQLGSGRVV